MFWGSQNFYAGFWLQTGSSPLTPGFSGSAVIIKLGSLISKESNMPSFRTPAYFMSKNCSLGSYKYLQKWQSLTKTTRNYNGLRGTFQLDKIFYLRSMLGRAPITSKQNGIPILIGM